MLNKYKVYASEIVKVSSEVWLTSEEIDELESMTSQERQEYLYDKVDDSWDRGDGLGITHVELGEIL